MSLLALPDIIGMLVLMGILGWLRVKYNNDGVYAWLLALFFILVEAVAVGILRQSPGLHVASHIVALDAYLLAGVTFGWPARHDLIPGKSYLPFFVLPAAPLFLLTTIYGADVAAGRPYIVTTSVSLFAGFVCIPLAAKKAGPRLALLTIHAFIWLPMLLLAMNGQLRWLVYWGLACLYSLVAYAFRCRMRSGSIGGTVIVAGFSIWALCFLLHPLVRGMPMWDTLLQQVWDMQKFLVILGMLLTLLEDETERRKAEAMHDVLTGLPNRRLFDDRLAQALERSMRSGKSAALFAIDLDGFKAINDTQGHAVGDLALKAAAEGLQAKVRSSDTLARCGGDEFCVIITDLARREDCERIASALRTAVGQMPMSDLPGGRLSASVGFALFPEDAATGEELYEVADGRMYADKRTGSQERSPLAIAAEGPVLVIRQSA